MATLQLELDRRRKKVEDTYPLVFKITCNRKQVMIGTGISVPAQEWDADITRPPRGAHYLYIQTNRWAILKT